MKILYLSQYFAPEMGAPAARVSELSRLWVKAGHDVTVLTGFPHYPSGVVPQEYRAKLRHLIMREDLDGVRVERTWLAALPNRKTWERILNYASFTVSAALRGSFLDSPDVVIATSPQLLECLETAPQSCGDCKRGVIQNPLPGFAIRQRSQPSSLYSNPIEVFSHDQVAEFRTVFLRNDSTRIMGKPCEHSDIVACFYPETA